jgi:hypothetical protein
VDQRGCFVGILYSCIILETGSNKNDNKINRLKFLALILPWLGIRFSGSKTMTIRFSQDASAILLGGAMMLAAQVATAEETWTFPTSGNNLGHSKVLTSGGKEVTVSAWSILTDTSNFAAADLYEWGLYGTGVVNS